MTSAAQRAREVADSAGAGAGVRLDDLHDHGSMQAVARLFDEVWGRPEDVGSLMPPETLTAVAHAGGQISAAFRDDAMVGATAAFVGLDDAGPFLHSHITGVLPDRAGQGVGRALKWHQRAWCLARGIERVRWTFDPLIRRNAVFNLVILGARVVGYHEDVYGRVQDARNAGLPTDRVVVEWELTAARVEAAAAGRTAEPDLAALRRAGATETLRVGEDGRPVIADAVDAGRRLVQVPADVEELRRTAPDAAAEWGTAVRDALGSALDRGFRVSGLTRDGWYVLTAERDVRELAERA